MSKLCFGKYEGSGNDFILVDDRSLSFSSSRVSSLCHRKFGIGADGLILLQTDPKADFRMRIFNADGSEAESCGNGLRCLLQFLRDLGEPFEKVRIAAGSRIVEGVWQDGLPCINLGAPRDFRKVQIGGWEVHAVDTGVPHAVLFVEDVRAVDVERLGPFFRHHSLFQPRGANVNFAELQKDGSIRVRTYERGVEGEVLACGTGAAAVGLFASRFFSLPNPLSIRSAGGTLSIHLDRGEIWLAGPATKVFVGEIK